MLPGNSINVTYTDSRATLSTPLRIVRVDDPTALPIVERGLESKRQDDRHQFFRRHRVGGVATQCRTWGTEQADIFRSAGSTLRVLEDGSGASTVDAASTTTTVQSLTSGSPQLPFFTDGVPRPTPAHHSHRVADHRAGGAHSASTPRCSPIPRSCRSTTPAADARRRHHAVRFHFHADDVSHLHILLQTPALARPPRRFRVTMAVLHAAVPQLAEQRGRRREAGQARPGRRGQSRCNRRCRPTSGVSIDSEMSNLISLQNTYSANAHVMSVVQQMMNSLLQAVNCKDSVRRRWRSTASAIGNTILGGSVKQADDQMASICRRSSRPARNATTYAGMGVNEGFAIAARSQLSNIGAFTDTMTKINTDDRRRQYGAAIARSVGKQMQTAREQRIADDGQRRADCRSRRRSRSCRRWSASSTRNPAIVTCFPAARSILSRWLRLTTF